MGQKPGDRPQLFKPSSVQSVEGDLQLMLEVKRGSAEAFRSLYEKYKGPVMSYVYQMVRREDVAEEIVQNVFMNIFRTREQYSEKAKVTTWIWTIARNTAVDYLRKKKELSLTVDPDTGETPQDRMISELSDAEALLLEEADRERVEACMAKLTEQQREALTLRTVSELSYDEIASTMKLSLSSIKSLIFRARNALLKCVGKGDES